MRFLFLVSIVLFIGACSHKGHHHHDEAHAGHSETHGEEAHSKAHGEAHAHDHSKPSEHSGCTHCSSHEKEHKAGEACADCGKKDGCTSGCDKSATTSLEHNPKLLKNISQEDFAKAFSANKAKIDKSCTNPAMKYCGKTTKDLTVTESEMTCLWTKVFRATRETLPELDGTPCAKMIKGFAKK